MSFRSQDELIRDLAYKGRDIEVVFILGSGLTTPSSDRKGVPSAEVMIGRIVALAEADNEIKTAFTERFAGTSSRDYQAVFAFLLEQKFPETVIAKEVRTAVLEAYNKRDGLFMERVLQGSKDACIEVEVDHQRWDLRPGLSSFGEIVSGIPKVFGRTILTTNFDPLIEIAVRNAGGSPVSTRMDKDGSLQNIDAWSHIIHVHGYWHGSEMLHTKLQLTARRPRLQTSLRKLMANCEVVVLGYGGWDDVLLQALQNLANDSDFNIHWCFNEVEPEQHEACRNVLQKLPNDTGKILFYSGIDCDVFLPNLRDRLIKKGSIVPSARDIQLKSLEEERAFLQDELSRQKVMRRDEREEVDGRRDLLRMQADLADRLMEFGEEIRSARSANMEINHNFEGVLRANAEQFDRLTGKMEELNSMTKDARKVNERAATLMVAIKKMALIEVLLFVGLVIILILFLAR